MNMEQHSDLEAIRQLKAQYFRFMDTQQWERWRDCFTPDISACYEGGPRADGDDQPHENWVEGREALVEHVRSMMRGVKSIHQGFMPEIELTSATTARAVWSMFDYLRLPTCNFKGWGHYHEDYVKADGRWKIRKIHLTRLHTEQEWL
ncbi:MAG: nuclear transport factor 2 family protein [Proteobacteria bacterium]|nr:nuclear transport factor 2 family protein [Pseudomonadota bacterium]